VERLRNEHTTKHSQASRARSTVGIVMDGIEAQSCTQTYREEF
jgi:hypothetical protein